MDRTISQTLIDIASTAIHEDQREEVGELTQKADEKRRHLNPFDLVWAEFGKPAPRFGLADAVGPRIQAGKRHLRHSADECASRILASGKVQPPPLGAPDKGYPALEEAPGRYVLQP